MRISYRACEISRSKSPPNWTYFSSRENTILRSQLAPRVGVSLGDISDASDGDDDDDTSSTGYQDYEEVINREFGLDPGRIYVIPNAIATEKFRPSLQKQTDKGTNQ